MCGCGEDNKCNYCNSNYFIGYDKQNTGYVLFSPAGSTGAPKSNGNTCTISTEDVDVNQN